MIATCARRARPFRIYLVAAGGMLAALAALVYSVNAAIDPYDMHGRSYAFNRVKPELREHSRLFKAAALSRLEPRVAAFGNSRTENGIAMRNAGWASGARFNAAVNGATIAEIAAMFRFASASAHLEQAVIGIDFYSFNANLPVDAEFDDALISESSAERPWLFALYAARYDFSWDTLVASARTLMGQHTLAPYEDDGHVNQTLLAQNVERNGGPAVVFAKTERTYIESMYFPPPARRFDRVDGQGRPTLDALREIVAIARRDRIDLRLFISPCHAHQWEVLRAVGLWPDWEAWKREVVALLEADAAAHPGEPPIPLWDFSGYNAYTTENIPLGRDARMHWYWDASHYRDALGDQVLDRIFGAGDAAFGTRLTRDNIDAHLAAIRTAQLDYQTSHAADVAHIKSMVTQTGRLASAER